MTHALVRRFKISGRLAGDANLIKARNMYEEILDEQMRDQGWVPLFDIVPAWSTSYEKDKHAYEFLLTMHGVWVGEDKAWTIEGISEGKELPKPTPTDK